jgi:hypothetical protein
LTAPVGLSYLYGSRGVNRMLMFVIATGIAIAQAEGCSKDIDCKGDRICENRQCVDPTAIRPGSGPPAAVEPLAPSRPAPLETSRRPAAEAAAESERRHHGLFLRPDLGVGYLTASASDPTAAVTLSGAAGSFGFSLGGTIAEGLILAGHVWDWNAVNPSVTVNGQSGSSSNTSLTLIAIGPELDYYFMPSNIFIGGTLALSRGSLGVNGNSYNTEVGFAAQFAVGKEWWVSDKWGLGLKGQFVVSSNKDSAAGNAPTWTGYAFGASFSATYN